MKSLAYLEIDSMSMPLHLEPWSPRLHPMLDADRLHHLMAPWRVLLPAALLDRIRFSVACLEAALRQPDLRRHLLARHGYTTTGLPAAGGFICYDFHLDETQGPRLIEINANAGGLLINRDQGWGRDPKGIEEAIVEMLKARWAIQQRGPLKRVLILDDAPEQQFLFAEFLLYQDLFRRHHWESHIVDAQAPLADDDGQTLIYNRLTDFYLKDHLDLRQRVLLPCPQTHALYADKRNLIDLRNPAWQQGLAPDQSQQLMSCIPDMREMSSAGLAWWWQERKSWFFKPAIGYGSKATYAGDKITRSTLEAIYQRGDYVAQELQPASRLKAGDEAMKMDLRAYAYDGEVLRLVARLYRGQTTNFRTPGGGFAPVHVV